MLAPNANPDTASAVVAGVLRDVAKREAAVSFQEIKARSRAMEPTRDARAALLRGGCGVIAEIKLSSPVFGPTGVARRDIADVARAIEEGGAHLIACQTERLRFDGSLQDMRLAREAVELPMVCRDVIVDPYQIHEARVLGADCVLLIVAALDDDALQSLSALAQSLGMDVLVEAHDGDELTRALQLPAHAGQPPLIGINNRSLRSFEVSLETTLSLRDRVTGGRRLVTESGVHTRADVERLRAADIHAFLVGEAFMREADPGEALRRLFFAEAAA